MLASRIFPALSVVLLLAAGCGGKSSPAFSPTGTPAPTSTPAPTPTPKPLTWDDLALTPPMGWNSYNHFNCEIDEQLIREIADTMESSGMRAAGYQYLNIDDCWMAGERDAGGNLAPDPKKFPGGMKALADYVHARGLKLGIYLDRGSKTCGGFPGSYGYETRDANLLASWGVDYLKYDNCNPVGNMVADYTNMSNALKATGRPIVFSMCNWGFPGYWVLGSNIAHLWRTTSDIKDNWESVMKIMDANNAFASFAGPGHWNDPDMLAVGNGGMSEAEYRAHFGMWAVMAAPLIAGNDLRGMDAATLAILTAPEVIAVDQDPLGIQGVLVGDIEGIALPEVYVKQLSGEGTFAVALLNRSGDPVDMTVRWEDIGLPAGPAAVRDLWERADRGVFAGGYTVNVPPHGLVLVKVVSLAGGSSAANPSE
jgi:alpha-galactosidase